MGTYTLYNRCKLDVVAVNFLEEMIEVQRIVCVEVIHYGQGVPFYPVFLQQVDALHYLGERRASLTVLAVLIVELLWPVDGHAYQPVVLFEEFAPLIRQQGTVGLDTVVDGTSPGIFLLQFHYSLVEAERTHQCFSAVPGKEYLWHGLRADVFADKFL